LNKREKEMIDLKKGETEKEIIFSWLEWILLENEESGPQPRISSPLLG